MADGTAGRLSTSPAGLDGLDGHGEPGALIVLEGIDRSGRSTHAAGLEVHLRDGGRTATRTSLGTALLAGPPLRRARSDPRPDPAAISLLYAADLAERLERVIRPALRAGIVVIVDRYAWTPMARAIARGVDPAWLDTVFGFAPRPDAVIWLDVEVATALRRRDREPDPFEAGLDLRLSSDVVESYRLFQARLSETFRVFASRHGFIRVAADGPPDAVQPEIDRIVDELLDDRRLATPEPPVALAPV
jgi:dTMP kinase